MAGIRFFQRLRGALSPARRGSTPRRARLGARLCRLEPLEARQLLSAAPFEMSSGVITIKDDVPPPFVITSPEPAPDVSFVVTAYVDHPLTGVLDGNLIVLEHEYEEFIAAGGDPAEFTPGNTDILGVADGRITVPVTTTEPLYWEHDPEPMNDDSQMVRTDNTAFRDPFLAEVEELGAEVQSIAAQGVSVCVAIDALDDLTRLDGVDQVRAQYVTHPGGYDAAKEYEAYMSVDMSEMLDADLYDAYQEFEEFQAEGGDFLDFSPSNPRVHVDRYGCVSVDVVAVEAVVSEEIVDGYGVEVRDEGFLSRLRTDGCLSNLEPGETWVSGDVTFLDLRWLAIVDGVERITLAGAGRQTDSNSTPADGDADGDPSGDAQLAVEQMVVPDSYTDLGEVDYRDLEFAAGSGGEHWYRLESVRDGLLTIAKHPAPFVVPDPAAISLFAVDGDGQLVELASGGYRIDYAATAGQEFFVRFTLDEEASHWKLANLVQVDEEAGELRVFGSDGADEIYCGAYPNLWAPEEPRPPVIGEAGATALVSVNGIMYGVGGPYCDGIYVEAGDGDHLSLSGDDGEDHFQMGFAYLNSADAESIGTTYKDGQLSGQWGSVSFRGGSVVEVDGQRGNDSARLDVSWSDAMLVAGPGSAVLTGSGCEYRVVGFETLDGNLPITANSRAELHGSAGHDEIAATEWGATLSGEGYTIAVTATAVQVYGEGGNDFASFSDSDGRDVFTADPAWATMTYSGGSVVQVYGCTTVEVTSQSGDDEAYLYDSPGDDRFEAHPDTATLKMSTGCEVTVNHVRYVHAYSTGGADSAFLYGSAGDDTFIGTPEYGKLYGDDFFYRAKGFDYVYGYAVAGGADGAYLCGSSGDDVLIQRDDSTRLYGDGFSLRAKHFAEVSSNGRVGDDVGYLFDTALDDLLKTEGISATLSNALYALTISDFATVHATSEKGGDDFAETFRPHDFDCLLHGHWDAPVFAASSGGGSQ